MYCPSPLVIRSKRASVIPWSAKTQPMCHAWCPCPPIGGAFGSEYPLLAMWPPRARWAVSFIW